MAVRWSGGGSNRWAEDLWFSEVGQTVGREEASDRRVVNQRGNQWRARGQREGAAATFFLTTISSAISALSRRLV
ncbi:hypothetical protein U1Q18_006732 [Sarracenia purpurea var. burkii]